jgi:hypothetical protein
MQNGKSHRLDGFPYEFYKAMWDSIGENLCKLASNVFASGRLSEFFNQGLIKLIPKNKVRNTIVHW